MSKRTDLLKMIRMYREETGIKDIDHHDVARWAKVRGWKLPTPPSAEDMLARYLSAAARTETRIDAEMGFVYRANHPYPVLTSGKQEVRWVDVDEHPDHHKMRLSMTVRRNQTAADVIQMTFDTMHWNNDNPTQEALPMPAADFTFDVNLAMAALKQQQKKAG